MAKDGLDYFPLNCQLDEKFELIEAEYGLTGFSVVVKLLQRIYGEHGYYCEWTNEVALLFGKKVGLGGNAVSEIIEASVRRGIFSKELFDKVDSKYKNVCIIGENVNIQDENVYISKQSKVKESNNIYMSIVDYLNEKCGTKYQNTAIETVQLILDKISRGFTYEDFKKVIDIKAAEWLGDEKMQKFLRPSTLFGNKFESYLNEKPVERKERQSKKAGKSTGNKFNQFPQRDYSEKDYSDMEKKLLGRNNDNGCK